MEVSDIIRNIVKDELKEIREELKIIRSMIENFMGYEELTGKELKELKRAQREIEEGKGILHVDVKKELGL